MTITKRHGLTIGMERVNAESYLYIKVIGILNHQDYQKITPLIESAVEGVNEPKLNLFFDAYELEGWELRAAWDDLKIGLKNGSDFNKIAIVGNRKWQEYAAKIGNWFTQGEIKHFDDAERALNWLITPAL
jgi:hypothetical protein